ncbi:hypothetical protein LZ31DRAFT_331074 [Colletotrichum somersetense]|nr:hypothetical protein LZ31DRAFT_331074 [Colletotrichum somersetense]
MVTCTGHPVQSSRSVSLSCCTRYFAFAAAAEEGPSQVNSPFGSAVSVISRRDTSRRPEPTRLDSTQTGLDSTRQTHSTLAGLPSNPTQPCPLPPQQGIHHRTVPKIFISHPPPTSTVPLACSPSIPPPSDTSIHLSLQP